MTSKNVFCEVLGQFADHPSFHVRLRSILQTSSYNLCLFSNGVLVRLSKNCFILHCHQKRGAFLSWNLGSLINAKFKDRKTERTKRFLQSTQVSQKSLNGPKIVLRLQKKKKKKCSRHREQKIAEKCVKYKAKKGT